MEKNVKTNEDLEIEKKYLVNNLAQVMQNVDLDNVKKIEIEQGYISSNPTIRIRKYNNEYCITYKARTKSGVSDDVIVNREIELPLTKESYEHMLSKIDYNLVSKTRYKIDLEDGLVAELDVFHGKLKGLVMVEVEFDSVDKANAFKKPIWFGEDVSSERKYKNLYLSQINNIQIL